MDGWIGLIVLTEFPSGQWSPAFKLHILSFVLARGWLHQCRQGWLAIDLDLT